MKQPSPETLLIAETIGSALLANNQFDYRKTEDQIRAMSITNIVVDGDRISIETARPGLVIGVKGSTLDLIQQQLPGKTLEIVESFSWSDLITPYDPVDFVDTDCDAYWMFNQDDLDQSGPGVV